MRFRSGLALLFLCAAACGPAVVSHVNDQVTFADLTQVSVVMPAASGRVSTGDGASTSYVVDAGRNDAGAPEVHWKTGAALYNGEYLAVPATNVLEFVEPPSANAGHPWTSGAPRFRVDGCTYVTEAYTGGGYVGHMIVPRHHLGYEIRAEIPCKRTTGVTVPFALETPWSNVTLRRTITHQRATQGTLAITGGNIMFIAIAPSAAGAATQTPAVEAVGIGIAGMGLLMLLGAVIFLPSDSWEETIVLPSR